MQQNSTSEEPGWYDTGTPAQVAADPNRHLRPVRSETRQPPSRKSDDAAAPSPEPGDRALRKMFRQACETIEKAKGERKAANERISDAMTDLELRGVPPEVTKIVARIASWDPEKRQAFDAAYVAARAYADLPLQRDMFRGS